MREEPKEQLLAIHQPIVDRYGDKILVSEGPHDALISISNSKGRVKAVVLLDANAVKMLVADLSDFLRGDGDA